MPSRYDDPYAGYGGSYGVEHQPRTNGQPAQAEADPEGVNILHGKRRAGTVQKDRYVKHLNDLWAAGYMPDTEHNARVAVVTDHPDMTESMLNHLIKDLPALPVPEEEQPGPVHKWTKRITSSLAWSHVTPAWRLTVYVLGLAVSCFVWVGSIVVLCSFRHTPVAFQLGGTAGILLGLACLALTIVLWVSDPKVGISGSAWS